MIISQVEIAEQMLYSMCMMFSLLLSFALSVSATPFQLESQPPRLSCHTQTESCPLWFYYDSNTCDCQCLPYWAFYCEGNDAFINSAHILTYDESKHVVSVTTSKRYFQSYGGYNTTKSGYILLPKNISRLNEYMCGPLNRKGFLCGECSDGFGPSMVCIDKCYNCSVTWHGMTLYLSLEFVPVTLFYLFVLIFHISVHSAPMTCFIMYSQVIITILSSSCSAHIHTPIIETEDPLSSVSKVILTLYGVFNLEFLHHIVPPFCISRQLNSIHIAWLGYISAFYPILLIALTWICVELHGHNFRLVVRLWKPFHRCFVSLRRGWDTKSDLIDVFASFLLLSYSKIMYQTLILLNTSIIQSLSLVDGHTSNSYVVSADASIKFGSAKYVAIAVAAGSIFCVFNLLPILLLVLYPYKIFRSALSKCRLDGFALNIFVDKFQHCYRDGLDGGRDMRSFSGLYFFLRVIVVWVVPVIAHLVLESRLLRGTVFSLTALFIALCRPYKKTSMNVLDTLLLSHLATICHIFSYNSKTVPVMQTLIFVPFAIFALLIFVRLIYRAQCRKHIFSLPLQLLTHLKVRRPDVGVVGQQQQLIQPTATYGTINN